MSKLYLCWAIHVLSVNPPQYCGTIHWNIHWRTPTRRGRGWGSFIYTKYPVSAPGVGAIEGDTFFLRDASRPYSRVGRFIADQCRCTEPKLPHKVSIRKMCMPPISEQQQDPYTEDRIAASTSEYFDGWVMVVRRCVCIPSNPSHRKYLCSVLTDFDNAFTHEFSTTTELLTWVCCVALLQ